MADADDVLTAAARVTFQSAEHGDLRGLDLLIPRLVGRGSPEVGAWRVALRAIRWSLDPASSEAPSPEEARRAAQPSHGCAEIVAKGCAVLERVAFCRFDRSLLEEWIAVHESLPTSDARPATEEVTLASARLWQRLLAGATDGLDDMARTLFNDASKKSASAEVIESTVIRALLALSAGALNDAIELARRASRMAQSEALPQLEYLANITLARVRRYSGRPHLALHILATLGRVAPTHWSGWIGWETLLAGGRPAPSTTEGSPSAPATAVPSAIAARNLHELLDTVRAGERSAFLTATNKLERDPGLWPHISQELTALLAALDPLGPAIPESMADWCRGEAPAIPWGLHGVGIPQDAAPQAEIATAYVVAQPGNGARRFLFPGLALAPPARLLARDSAKSGGRTETGIAALALAGPSGMTRDAFFRSVYGFPFVAYRHRAVLDVLCHRMRGLLGDAGEIRREGGDAAAASNEVVSSPPPAGPWITMVLREAIIVPDMRCVLPTADRVLRALSTLGATSATAAADSLRMPLRTVQAVLQQLVSEGACMLERDGRRVAYRIEDTTFTQVTSA